MDQYRLRSFNGASPAEIQDAMERAEVVFFDRSTVELPSEADLQFMREGLPRELQVKNISYHPESDSIPRFEAAVHVTFLKPGAFDARNLITIPHAKLLRVLGKLSAQQLGLVEAAVRIWLGFPTSEA